MANNVQVIELNEEQLAQLNKQNISDEEVKALEHRISKARTQLILDHPFIGTIAMQMPMTVSKTPLAQMMNPTAKTDGRRVEFNPEFCKNFTDEEMTFLVAHECFHPMLEHTFRRGPRDPMKFNMAADYVINQLLVDENIGKFIEGGCLDQALYNKGGGTSEGIYNVIPDPPKGKDGKDGKYGLHGQDGSSNNGQRAYDEIEQPGNSEEERNQMAGEWQVRVAQAAQAAKMMGKLSANMERLVGEVLAPKVNWRDVLRRFVEKLKSDDRSFARPNRRFLPQDMYLPSRSGEVLGEIAFAIDCSGSIGQEELDQFAAEIYEVKESGNPRKIHLLYFDSEVCHYEGFNHDEDVHVEAHGGGGTAFSPIFRYMDKHGIEPIATIFLTDLYCNDYGPAPDHPVLWVSTMDHGDTGYGAPPFGEVVLMNPKVTG